MAWNVICDLCGWKFKNTEVRKRWDGLLVCRKDWETDHPQKHIRVQTDPVPVPSDLIRQAPDSTFITFDYIWDKTPSTGTITITGYSPEVLIDTPN